MTLNFHRRDRDGWIRISYHQRTNFGISETKDALDTQATLFVRRFFDRPQKNSHPRPAALQKRRRPERQLLHRGSHPRRHLLRRATTESPGQRDPPPHRRGKDQPRRRTKDHLRHLVRHRHLLLLAVIALVIIVLRQVNRLQTAQSIITEAHTKEQAANQRLVEANNKLSEANKIKEEYIGYFFNADSESFDKIGQFKKALEQKIAYRKWDDVITLVNNTNPKKEKEELLRNFDKVFLKLFPDFTQRFNDMFRDEDKIQLKDNELLNTDIRIFALIRMGIHENEKIARILEYSVNTINTYKTRIKNKSIVPNEEFEQRIMEIRTI